MKPKQKVAKKKEIKLVLSLQLNVLPIVKVTRLSRLRIEKTRNIFRR